MHAWFEIVDSVLSPRRVHLERCLHERDRHVAARRVEAERNVRAIQECERGIVALRDEVFAANDGFVGARMTELERTWRRLTRVDPDAGLMDLWARVAPASWIDEKRWRDSSPATRLDAAVMLAADITGVLAAESAVRAFGAALAGWNTPLGSKIAWRLEDEASQEAPDYTGALLAEPLRVACEEIAASHPFAVAEGRARRLEQEVHDAARTRIAARPVLARSIAHASFVDYVVHAAGLRDRLNPVAPLCALWRTGYGIAAIDARGVTLEIPRTA